MQRGVSPWLVRALYLIALLMAISPLVEYVTTIWPLRPGDLVWRYGALGLGAGHLPNVTVGLAALLMIAYWRGHRAMFYAAGLASAAGAVLILPAMAMFALDALQFRALREEELRGAVLISGVLQELKYLVSALAMGCLGMGASQMGGSHFPRAVEPSPGALRAGAR
jgi:hypothetical protein